MNTPRPTERRAYVNTLAELTAEYHVLRVGKLQAEYVAGIVRLTDDNLDVVLTQPRWAYIISKTDRREKFVDVAFAAISDPDEVHRDRHSENAIFYKRVGDKAYLKVVVWLQMTKTDRQHSIGDFYLKDAKRVARDRAANLLWRK